MPTGTGLRAVFDEACVVRNLRPTVVIQASAVDSVADLAARGLGVRILSSSLADPCEARYDVLPIRDVLIPAVLAVLWRRSGSVAVRNLTERCLTAFRIWTSAA